VRCWRWEDIASGQIRAVFPAAETSWGAERVTPGQDVLKIDGVSVFFSQQQTLGEGLRRTPATRIRAVDDFSLNIRQATTVGLVGESGSGKTTLARCIVGLQERNAGEMTLVHAPLPPRLAERDIDTLRHLQLVFQNPEHALNPYQSVGEILSLPLQVLQGLPRDRVRHEVERLLEMVHLAGYAARKPSQLSGGEVQRIALARAFAANPALLVADEPVSSLDVSVQAAVLNLLNELQLQHGSALLFISHDIAVVGYLSDQIAVMFAGKLLQFSSQHEFFEPPHHPYTEDLLACIPIHPPGSRPKPPLLDSSDPPVSGGVRGCPYYKRCQYRIEGTCDRIDPPWQVTEGGGRIYCHVSPVELHSAQVEHPAHNMNRERSDP
jgi:peptide/nickel transport system ATP-binding protein